MKRLVFIAGGGAALIGAALYAYTTVSAETDRVVLKDTDPVIVALGASVYEANCASCHGANLEGQAIGARLMKMDVSPLRPMMKPDTHGTMTGTRCFGSPNTGRVPLSAIPTTLRTCQSTKAF